MTQSPILQNLNPQQTQAVQTVQGPVLVLAGPGSGKTGVLTRRIAYMIEEAGVAPWNILAVTFTNKAAREMGERVERLFDGKFGEPLPGQKPRLGGVTIGTFHNLCARVLRVETEHLGFERNWVIYDTADQRGLIRALLAEMNLDEKRFNPHAIKSYISTQKNELVTPKNCKPQVYFEEIATRVYEQYQVALKNNNAMDFDDLLMHTTLLLKNNEEVRVKYQQKWPYLLVDEFQDTNTAQYSLLKYMAGSPTDNRNIFCVGDEDQSIYRFRGADYRNVIRFRDSYPEATVILLEQNYRSTQMILDVANAVIQNNRNRTPKQLHTDNGHGIPVYLHEAYNEMEEASYICDEIERLARTREFSLGDFAVMYRTNAQSRALEETFVRRQLRHKLVGATRFYERKEIKDALGYLRLVNNPADTVALDRIINVPTRGIGLKTYASLKSWAASIGLQPTAALSVLRHGPDKVGKSRGIVLPEGAYTAPSIAKRSQTALVKFITLLESWMDVVAQSQFTTVADLLDRILYDTGYVDVLRDGTDEGEERFENLQELRSVAAQYRQGMPDMQPEQTPLSMFLEEVSLVSDADQVEEGSGAVTLMTLHTAKGLEFPAVFMTGLEEGLLPHSRSLQSGDPEDLEEERRLCYVGITRAKRRLYLTHTYQRTVWGDAHLQLPSQFLDEIPTELLSGMVNKQKRQQDTYQRATSWDSGGSSRSNTSSWGSGGSDGGDYNHNYRKRGQRSQTQKRSYNWQSESGNLGESDSRRRANRQNQHAGNQGSSANYWTPGGSSSGASGGSSGSSSGGSQRRRSRPESSSTGPRTNRQRAEIRGGSRVSPSNSRPAQFKRMESVKHSVFGVGTVVESVVTVDDEEVTVAFPGVGIKTLSASMAGLEKL
ncbi:MAG: UvrD-helicase domain-containing protein [Chloroflexota bacterium]